MSANSETEIRMTEQTPPAAPEAPKAPEAGKQSEKTPPWGSAENFNPEKAWELIQNLRSEKGGADPSFKAEIDQMRAEQQKQRDALALALGVKPEEASNSDKLAQQIDGLRSQILASEKRALAVEFKVPEAMLTASSADDLRAQAASLAEFAQAAHYAAISASPPAAPPAFQANPGQGQGSTPTPEAQAAAEYEKFYPAKP